MLQRIARRVMHVLRVQKILYSCSTTDTDPTTLYQSNVIHVQRVHIKMSMDLLLVKRAQNTMQRVILLVIRVLMVIYLQMGNV